MKKFISLTLVVAMVAMSSVTAFAASTLTSAASATKASTGDEFIITETLDTSNGVKTIGFKIKFDLNDFELGTSDESDAVAAEYADYIGTTEYPTLDALTLEALGRQSYVDDGYAATYGGYASNKNLGSATIGYEEIDGNGYVGFGYAITTAKGNLNKIDNMLLGGAVLKVKTTEKKAAKIYVDQASFTGSDNAKVSLVTNEIVINLNGYGEGPVEDKTVTAEEDANGVTTIKYGKDYTGSKALEGKKIVVKTLADTDNITKETRFNVTFGDETKPYGGTLWDQLGLEGKGALAVNKLTIAIAFDADVENVTAANVSVALVK